MAGISKGQAIREFFSTPARSVTLQELAEFFKANPPGGEREQIALDCAKALGKELAAAA